LDATFSTALAATTSNGGSTGIAGGDEAPAEACAAFCTLYNKTYYGGTAVASDYNNADSTDKLPYEAANDWSSDLGCAAYSF
jgi:hypothetical protein